MLFLLGYSQLRHALDVERRKRESQVTHVSFTSAGISVRDELASGTVKWRVCAGLMNCKGLVLLLIGSAYITIPRSALSGEAMDYIKFCLSASRGWPRCAKCGYDLRGQTVPRCPECGCATKSLGKEDCTVGP